MAMGSAISKLSAIVQPTGKYKKKIWLDLNMYQNHILIHIDFTLHGYVTMIEFSCKVHCILTSK